MNPASLKGAVYVAAGLIVVTIPDVSMTLLRLVLAAALIVSGGSDLWGHFRHRVDRHGVWRAALDIVTGLGLLLVPELAGRAIVLVLVGYLVVAGAMSLYRAFSLSRAGEAYHVDLTRGVLSLCLAAVTMVIPGAMVSLAIVSAAFVAMVVGGMMLSYGMTHQPGEAALINRPLVLEIFRSWLTDRDVGADRRGVIADSLYFEAPDRTHKIASYVVMLALSVTIASFAILQDSTAVVIGAMLVAPLMTPIMGCAAGLVAGWRQRVLASLSVVAASVTGAIGLAWILASWIPAMVPLGVNTQILSRSSPTLLDMAIAVAAGAAGAYATIDDRVSSSLTGVAVAVALVPPLSVTGIALEAGRWSAALGSFLLFGTNLVSIILASVVVFVLVGFTPIGETIKRRGAISDLLVVVVVAALLIMVPLGLIGEDVLTNSARRSQAQHQVDEWLGGSTTLRLDKIAIRADEIDIVLSGTGELPSLEELEDAISASFGRPTTVTVEVYPSVVISYSDAEGRREVGDATAATNEPGPEAANEGGESPE